MRVLGIDPGSQTLGWGVVEGSGLKYSVVDFGTVKSSPREDFSKRLLKIFDQLLCGKNLWPLRESFVI